MHFAREGAHVAIVYLDAEQKDAEETAALVEKEGRKCLKFAGDVGVPEASTGFGSRVCVWGRGGRLGVPRRQQCMLRVSSGALT